MIITYDMHHSKISMLMNCLIIRYYVARVREDMYRLQSPQKLNPVEPHQPAFLDRYNRPMKLNQVSYD